MSAELKIVKYDMTFEDKWDDFVINKSVNGTFLQTRQFLNYHKDRFKDNSLIFIYGNDIVAVLPANIENVDKKSLLSHNGSTFGGLIISKSHCKIKYLELIFCEFDKYLKENMFKTVVIKQTSFLYQNECSELIDYFLFLYGYKCCYELGYYIDFKNYKEEVIDNFSSSRRRDYRYSLKNKFNFNELTTKDEIASFYEILCDNYRKFEKIPVHTLDNLYDLFFNRLIGKIRFYGVKQNDEYIAGSMVFTFDNKVFHTQYLACLQGKGESYVNEFMYKSLIDEAKNCGFECISFGTATLNGGKELNRNLALYKEGFGTNEYINKTYVKEYEAIKC